jgi:hypothetical protein
MPPVDEGPVVVPGELVRHQTAGFADGSTSVCGGRSRAKTADRPYAMCHPACNRWKCRIGVPMRFRPAGPLRGGSAQPAIYLE